MPYKRGVNHGQVGTDHGHRVWMTVFPRCLIMVAGGSDHDSTSETMIHPTPPEVKRCRIMVHRRRIMVTQPRIMAPAR